MNGIQNKTVRVMVVDDHPEVLKTLKKILERRGYDVRDFNNPLQALEELKTTKPDIVLSDLIMPQLNGIDFLSEAKKMHPTLPFIIMTAFATVDTAIHATKFGAFDYLRKPFEISKIYDTLEKAIHPVPA